jgi:hypothetical protein
MILLSQRSACRNFFVAQVRGSIVVGGWKRKNPKSKAKVDH